MFFFVYLCKMNKANPKYSPRRVLFFVSAVICVALATLGIVTPVLPTTPFLLLAAFLFAQSSSKARKWLLENKVFGSYLSNYYNNTPIPLKQKISTLIVLWLGLSATFYFANPSTWLVILLICVGIGVSTHVCLLGNTKAIKEKILYKFLLKKTHNKHY